MTDKEIRELCNKLEGTYSDGGYVSVATLFNRALNEGKISVEVRDKAREYYGRLWNYVGDWSLMLKEVLKTGPLLLRVIYTSFNETILIFTIKGGITMKVTITIEIDDEELYSEIVTTEKNQNSPSQYARYFDGACVGWTKDPEYNLMYLQTQQVNANSKLRAKGHLFLNEVYDMLGLPRTEEGQVVGWIYDEKNPIGDNFVDFGITENRNTDFINGRENVAFLDFNVDGNIMKHI